jgi:hypothetical protein
LVKQGARNSAAAGKSIGLIGDLPWKNSFCVNADGHGKLPQGRDCPSSPNIGLACGLPDRVLGFAGAFPSQEGQGLSAVQHHSHEEVFQLAFQPIPQDILANGLVGIRYQQEAIVA